MNFTNNFENSIEKFCYDIFNNASFMNSKLRKTSSVGLVIVKDLEECCERIRFFRYDMFIEDENIECLRIYAYKNAVTQDICFSLLFEMKPPRRERKKFKALLAEACQREEISIDGYWFSITKSYLDENALLDSDVASHASDLLALYEKMTALRTSILEVIPQST